MLIEFNCSPLVTPRSSKSLTNAGLSEVLLANWPIGRHGKLFLEVNGRPTEYTLISERGVFIAKSGGVAISYRVKENGGFIVAEVENVSLPSKERVSYTPPPKTPEWIGKVTLKKR